MNAKHLEGNHNSLEKTVCNWLVGTALILEGNHN